MTYALKTLGDAVFAHSLEQELLRQIVSIADAAWAYSPNTTPDLLAIQTLAQRAIQMNEVTNEIFQELIAGRRGELVKDCLQGIELITPAHGGDYSDDSAKEAGLPAVGRDEDERSAA